MVEDYRLEGKEQDYSEAKQWKIAVIAATLIVRKEARSRETAVDRAREIFRLQSEGFHDITGTTTTLNEAQMPVEPRDDAQRRQIHKIAQELIDAGLVEDEGFEV